MAERRGLNKIERILYQGVHGEKSKGFQSVSDDTKNKSKDILDIGEIKKIFNSYGINDYCDLYYAEIKLIRQILIDNKLGGFFKEKIGIPLYRPISLEDKIKFGRIIGINKEPYEDLVLKVNEELKSNGINSIIELRAMRVIDFLNVLLKSNRLKFFLRTFSKKDFDKITPEDVLEFGVRACLDETGVNELKINMIQLLENIKIRDIRDLNDMILDDFKKLVEENKLIKYYFEFILKKFVTRIRQPDIEKFGIDIGLPLDYYKNDKIKSFLIENNINSYQDFKKINRDELETLLWDNNVCRTILKEIGILHQRDIRERHFQRFARKIGLSGVPRHFEYNETNSKNKLIKILGYHNISTKKGLNELGVKPFKRILKSDKNRDSLGEVKAYLKHKLGKSILDIRLPDLDKIGELLFN